MFLYFWYLGAVLKFFVSGRLIMKEWCRHLPAFSLFVFACTAKSLFLIPLYGSPLYSEVVRLSAPWLTVLQVAAGDESFVLFTQWVPRFKALGWAAMLVCVAIAFGLAQWTDVSNTFSLDATSALERGAGFGIAIVLSIAVFSYGRFNHGRPKAAYWHACCLALLSLSNAVGWQLMLTKVNPRYAIWTMVLGGVIPFAGWLLIVREAPTQWKLSFLFRKPQAFNSNGTIVASR